MNRDVVVQLRRYLDTIEAAAPPITIDELEQTSGRQAGRAHESGRDLMDFDLREPDESPAPTPWNRWAVVAVAVVAAVVLVVGIAVVDDGSVVPEPANSPTVTEPRPSPTSTDPVVPIDGDDAAVWTSADGIIWSRVAHDEAVFGGSNDQRMREVTVGGPGLVAVGEDGTRGTRQPSNDQDAAVWVSVDGITWTRVAHDEAVFGGDGDQFMSDVTVGGPGLVAVGGDDAGGFDAAVWTSVDGVTWSRIPHDDAVFGGGHVFGVTPGGPGLVAIGDMNAAGGGADAAVWTSVDGITWTRVPHDEAVFGGVDNQHMIDVTVGGPGLVAVGFDGNGADQAAVWTSVDGFKWSRVPREIMPTGEAPNAMWSVTVGGPGLVAVGTTWPPDSAAVWTSADGLTWSRIPHDEEVFSGTMLDVAGGGPGLVAVGDSVWTSVDGITWSRAPDPEADSAYRWGVTAGGPGLVAVGAWGASRSATTSSPSTSEPSPSS